MNASTVIHLALFSECEFNARPLLQKQMGIGKLTNSFSVKVFDRDNLFKFDVLSHNPDYLNN